MVPYKVATWNLRDITVEKVLLFALLLDWERPVSSFSASLDDLHPAGPFRHIIWDRGHCYNLPPTFPSSDAKWKIRTTPKPNRKNTLIVTEEEVAHGRLSKLH
jgi:hypothetical protein